MHICIVHRYITYYMYNAHIYVCTLYMHTYMHIYINCSCYFKCIYGKPNNSINMAKVGMLTCVSLPTFSCHTGYLDLPWIWQKQDIMLSQGTSGSHRGLLHRWLNSGSQGPFSSCCWGF